jgi:hypothetical protein
MPFTRDATAQMTASRRARREAHKCPNTALHSLLRDGPLTADRALSWGICGPLIGIIYTLHHTRSVPQDKKSHQAGGMAAIFYRAIRIPILHVALPLNPWVQVKNGCHYPSLPGCTCPMRTDFGTPSLGKGSSTGTPAIIPNQNDQQ